VLLLCDGLPIRGHQEDHDFPGFVPDLCVCSFCRCLPLCHSSRRLRNLSCPIASFYRDLKPLRWVSRWQSAQSVIRFLSVSSPSRLREQNVVDLEVIGNPAVLASPSITFQHFDAKFVIRICAEPKSRSSRLEIIHRTLSICSTTLVSVRDD
jgi:hypothetical protein